MNGAPVSDRGTPEASAALAAEEWNFDGLVGPTHNYAGLSPGNLASEAHRGRISNPRAAALQGLEKMRLLHELGVPQAILPPPPRPAFAWLARLGMGHDAQAALSRAAREAPALLAAAWSASSMWTANAATVSPSADTADGRVHLTPANLAGEAHRRLELESTAATLRAVFADPAVFAHHPPIPDRFGDEGAANHLRLAGDYGSPGVQIFVYGTPEEPGARRPRRHPGRQHERASRAVARQHGLHPDRVVFVQQDPAAIDSGVFHNDVIASADRDWLWLHEGAWAGGGDRAREISSHLKRAGVDHRFDLDREENLPLSLAVSTYLYNCQVVKLPGGARAWIGPEEGRGVAAVRTILERFEDEGVVSALHYVDLRESMRNGGGPACLRLRVVLRPHEARAIAGGVAYSEALHRRLADWIESRYRDRVGPADLSDGAFAAECLDVQRGVCERLGLPALAELEPGRSASSAIQER